MDSKEFASEQYDRIYATGGAERIYDVPYRQSGYYPLFREVQRILKRQNVQSVLEVGCGTGGLAHLLKDREPHIRYQGFDFSPVAVQRASARVSEPEDFFVGDAKAKESYRGDFDSIVCTEVLEHIEADLEVVAQWPAGAYCVCSVPNFDADNHVRHFTSEEDVRRRYGSLIDIERIVKVKKPFLTDLSARSRARALLWNRYRPRRLLAILGLVSSETLGGWYLFAGRRTHVQATADPTGRDHSL
jgi:SAM-dependent methyltransferase